MRARKHKAPRVETQGAYAEKTITAVQRESDADAPLGGLAPGGLGKVQVIGGCVLGPVPLMTGPVRPLEPFFSAIVLLVFGLLDAGGLGKVQVTGGCVLGPVPLTTIQFGPLSHFSG